MTGVLQCLMAGGVGFVVNSNNYANSYLGVTTNPTTTFVTDGTCTYATGGGAAPNWGTPTVAGVGSLYWINFTLGAGNGTATGTASATGSWLQLNASRNYGIVAAPAGQVRTRSLTYQISSDSGGSVIVGSGGIVLESDRS